jgi:chromosome segregation ATPase
LDSTIIVAIIALVGALVGSGGVTIFLARSNKDSIVAKTANDSIDAVVKSMERLEKDVNRQESENKALRDRVSALEHALSKTSEATAEALRVTSDAAAAALRTTADAAAAALKTSNERTESLEARILVLRDAVVALGGDIEKINREGKVGRPGPKGPVGDKGPPGSE